MTDRKRKKRVRGRGGPRAGPLLAVLAAVVLVPLGLYLATSTTEPAVTSVFHRAWVTEGPAGAVLLLQEGRYTEAVQSYDPDYSTGESSSTSLHAHRVADGARLGTLPIGAGDPGVLGVFDGRVWFGRRESVALLDAERLRPVHDAESIRRALATDLPGGFELARGRRFDPYTGRLGLRGAGGEQLWLSMDLSLAEATPGRSLVPEDRDCATSAAGLVGNPQLRQCLHPESAPATAIVTSRPSALGGGPPRLTDLLVSGVAAGRGPDAEPLWTTHIDELVPASAGPAALLGTGQLAPRRVAVMLRTGDTTVHLVELDPVDGRVLGRRRVVHSPEDPSG